MSLIHVALGLTTMATPPYAARISEQLMPAGLHACSPAGRIGRDASLMSVSPRQNFWNPPPVPDCPTVTRALLPAFRNSSATASLRTKTVLDPSTLISDGAWAASVPGWL